MFSSTRGYLSAAVLACLAITGIAASDALSQLGVSIPAAQKAAVDAVENGYVNYGLAAQSFKAAAAPVRARLAEGAIAWAKSYTASADFAQKYAERRTARKPVEPEFNGTPEEELQRRIDEQVKSLEESKASIASMPPEMRKQMEEAVNQAAAAIRQLNTPEMRTMQLTGIQSERQGEMTQYQQAMERWGTEFPENANMAIARRLKAFLETSADVDYSAAVQARNGKMMFVNEAYEDKSSEWKLCYRAGREPVEAARRAATAWLSELEAGR
jgi:hypothetical protein